MKTKKQKLSWNEIDPTKLGPSTSRSYYYYERSAAKAERWRRAFEARCLEELGIPTTHSLRFSYKLGRLRVALTENWVRHDAKDFASVKAILSSAANKHRSSSALTEDE